MSHGISINSYVVQGERTALIDLIEDVRNKERKLFRERFSFRVISKEAAVFERTFLQRTLTNHIEERRVLSLQWFIFSTYYISQ